MPEFKLPYLQAMRQQAPKMFNRLNREGTLDQHAQDKAIEAHRLYQDLTKGAQKEPEAREAFEQVMAQMLEFPPEPKTLQQQEKSALLNQPQT